MKLGFLLSLLAFLCVSQGYGLELTDDVATSLEDADGSISWETQEDVSAREAEEDESCDARVAEAEARVEDVLRQVTAFMAVADEKYLKAYTDMKAEYTKFQKAVSNLPSSNVRYVVQPSECDQTQTTTTLAPTTTRRRIVRPKKRYGDPLISGKVHHVPDASLSASTAQAKFAAKCSRLVTPITEGCHAMVWIPEESDKHPWIEADFGEMYTVSSVVTDGYIDKTKPDEPEWVSKFTLAYKIGDRWRHVEHNSRWTHRKREFMNYFNTYHRYPRTQYLNKEMFNTTAVRLFPTKCEHACAIRWEVKGWPVGSTTPTPTQ